MTPEILDSIIADLCNSHVLKFSQRYAIRRLREERNDLQSQLAAANRALFQAQEAAKHQGERADAAVKALKDARGQDLRLELLSFCGWLSGRPGVISLGHDCVVPKSALLSATDEYIEIHGATPVPAQPVAQMPELTEQIAVWLDEAADDVIGWGGYASEHFQKKHDLSGTAQAYRDRAASIRAALAASTAAATKGVCQHCLPIVGAELAGRCAAAKPEDAARGYRDDDVSTDEFIGGNS